MSYLSVSTWSLHRLLGPMYWTVWDEEQKKQKTQTEQQGNVINLLNLPDILAAKGFKALEVCHFHFQTTESEYLEQFNQACENAGIRLYTLLIDYGDISSADEVRTHADMKFIKNWIDIAAKVGAERVRIIAGDAQPDDKEALARTSQHLNELATYANSLGVNIVTENFRSLTSTSENCLYLVEHLDQRLKLITDFGNMSGTTKYDELAKIIPHSDSIHAKAHYDEDGMPDEKEFRKCLNLLKQANYNGPIVLIYDGPGDMWEGINRVGEIVKDYL